MSSMGSSNGTTPLDGGVLFVREVRVLSAEQYAKLRQ